MIINWGDVPFKAFITVTYPTGTCTATLGDESYTHSGGGTTTFIVKRKGTWTVSLVSGAFKDSASVSITKHGETKAVKLVGYVYNSGTENVPLELQYDSQSEPAHGKGTVRKDSSAIYMMVPNQNNSPGITSSAAVNFAGMKTMYVEITDPWYKSSAINSGLILSFCASKTPYYMCNRTNISQTKIAMSSLAAGTYSLAVPSGCTSAYIGVHLYSAYTTDSAHSQLTCNVTKIWFE